VQLCCATKLPYATVRVATAASHITNIASVNSVDNVLAGSLVLVSTVANKSVNSI